MLSRISLCGVLKWLYWRFRLKYQHCHCDGSKLTVLNGDFTFSVVRTQNGLIDAPLLDHRADCALAVRTVVGGVLTQLQSGLKGFRQRGHYISLPHTTQITIFPPSWWSLLRRWELSEFCCVEKAKPLCMVSKQETILYAVDMQGK